MKFSHLYTVLWFDHISNMPTKQIVHTSEGNKPPIKNTNDNNKVGEESKRPHLSRTTSSPKATAPRKKEG